MSPRRSDRLRGALIVGAAQRRRRGADHLPVGFPNTTYVTINRCTATFSGQSLDASTVLVMYTRFGDANLDGAVNLQDFNKLAANFGTSGSGVWTQGDFNYDGNVNLQDFNKLAANFGLSASGPEVTATDWARLGAAVPEPAAFALFGAAASAGMPRRCRRRR